MDRLSRGSHRGHRRSVRIRPLVDDPQRIEREGGSEARGVGGGRHGPRGASTPGPGLFSTYRGTVG